MDSIFAVFFTVKRSAPEARRLFYVNKLAQHPADHRVTVLEALIIPFGGKTAAVLIASAPDQATLQATVAPSGEAFEIESYPVAEYNHDPSAPDPDVCMITIAQRAASSDTASQATLPPQMRLRARLAPGCPYGHIWLASTDDINCTRLLMQAATGQLAIAKRTVTPRGFVDGQLAGSRQARLRAQVAVPAAAQAIPASDLAATTYRVHNTGTTALFGSADGALALDYLHLQNPKSTFAPASNTPVNGPLYLWNTQPGELQICFDLIIPASGNFHGSSSQTVQTFQTIYTQPVAVVSGLEGAQLEVSLDSGISVRNVTPESDLLNQILHSTSDDAPWPEDSYTGQEAAAYNYILSLLPGMTPPKNGTILPGLIESITYPAGADFPETVFTTVKSHLIEETTFFQYSSDWFGPAGILTAINSQVVQAATNSLTTVTHLIQISDETNVELIFETIFEDILTVVSFIPAIGPVISGALNIAFTTAKILLAQSGKGNEINATVAELSQAITTTLQALVNATAQQATTINGNYGKLRAFADAAASGVFTAAKFGATVQNAGHGSSSEPKLNQGYIAAAGQAWEITFFKALLYIPFTPSCHAELQATPAFTQTWNPASGNSQFVYALPVTTKDNSGNLSAQFLVCSCMSNATSEVNTRLFAPDQLGINPIAFFLGLDGWKYAIPTYTEVETALGDNPIVSVG